MSWWSGIERSRHAGSAALLCSAALGALALWLLLRLVWTLLPRSDAALAAVPAQAGVVSAAAQPVPSIAQWHLFGTSPLASNGGAGTAARALALILRGTFAEADPNAGIAVISEAGHPERAWRVGQEVVAGARLTAVYADRVVLQQGGREQTLALPRDRNLTPGNIVRPTPATVTGRAGSAMSSSGTAAGAAEMAAVPQGASPGWQQTLAHLRQNPAELAQRVQIVPVLDGAKMAGVRVSAGSDPVADATDRAARRRRPHCGQWHPDRLARARPGHPLGPDPCPLRPRDRLARRPLHRSRRRLAMNRFCSRGIFTMCRAFQPIVLGVLAACACAAASAQLVPTPADGPAGHSVSVDGRHTLNLKDADIQALIATVSEITGKNFIVAPERAGQGHGDLGAADAAGRALRRIPVGAARARLRRGRLRQHGASIVPEALAQQDGASATRRTAWARGR